MGHGVRDAGGPSDASPPPGPSVGVVLPAGGSGSRMAEAGAPPKQFRRLGGAPVLVQTLRAFHRHPAVDVAVVVVPVGEEAATRALLAEYGANRRSNECDSGSAGLLLLNNRHGPVQGNWTWHGKRHDAPDLL